MTDTKHTPGPWYGKYSIYTDKGYVASESTGETIAVCFTGEADTLLLPASPDLLEALEACVQWITANIKAKSDVFYDSVVETLLRENKTLQKANAAIAKAKGE